MAGQWYARLGCLGSLFLWQGQGALDEIEHRLAACALDRVGLHAANAVEAGGIIGQVLGKLRKSVVAHDPAPRDVAWAGLLPTPLGQLSRDHQILARWTADLESAAWSTVIDFGLAKRALVDALAQGNRWRPRARRKPPV